MANMVKVVIADKVVDVCLEPSLKDAPDVTGGGDGVCPVPMS